MAKPPHGPRSVMSAQRNTAVKTTHLSRQLIIDAALMLAEDEGVENLSVRKVAMRLGVTPMALYKHFNNKEELLSFALEAFIARADVIPKEELPWDDWLIHVGRRMYAALCDDCDWVPLLGSMRIGAEGAQVTDAFVSKLTSAGFSVDDALRAYLAVIQSVLGAVCLQSSMSKAGPKPDRLVKMEQIDIGLPMIATALRLNANESAG